jgi:hypothetical protein
MTVTKRVDEFVPKNKWIASLSNGETVFEDARPGEVAAWERLANYIKEHKLAITRLRVQIAGLEVDLPPNQEGYIQKKKVISTGAWTVKQLCVGHVQDGRALIHHLDENRGSQTVYDNDPGVPFTIYRHDQGECKRKCCA